MLYSKQNRISVQIFPFEVIHQPQHCDGQAIYKHSWHSAKDVKNMLYKMDIIKHTLTSTTGHSSILFNISTQCHGNIYVTQLSYLFNPNIYDLKGAMYSVGTFVYDCLSTRTSIISPFFFLITTDLKQLYQEKNRRACAYP